jgi:hypothetical protein
LATYDIGNAGKLLIGGNGGGLDKELVTALSVRSGILLHSLEKD